MADEKDKRPGYSDAVVNRILSDISDPSERKEKEEWLKAFGTTMLVLNGANLEVPEDGVKKEITEADIDAKVAMIEDPTERERMKQATIVFYQTFGLFHV